MSAQKRSIALAGAVSIAAHAAALAQGPSPPDTPMPAHAPSRPTPPLAAPGAASARDALRGPRVVDARAAAPTLVHRTFNGALRRLAVDPGEAALDVLALDEDARQRALAILDERAAILDRIVGANLERLAELRTAAEAGRGLRVLQIASELHRRFVREAGDAALADRIAAVLPSHDAQRLREVVEEYWDAVVREEGGERVGRIEAFVIQRRAALGVFASEIERAIARLRADAADAEDAWDRMLGALDLSPAQEREIRGMGREFYVGANLNPTRQDTADFLIRVYHTLDESQRERFFQIIIAAQ